MCVWVNWPAPVPSPQLAHTVTEMAAIASQRVASNIVAVITHSPAGVHHYTAGAVLPHPVNPVAPGSAIAPIAYICLLSLTTVDMTVLGFTVLDVANNPILVTTVSGRPRPNTFFSRDWEPTLLKWRNKLAGSEQLVRSSKLW